MKINSLSELRRLAGVKSRAMRNAPRDLQRAGRPQAAPQLRRQVQDLRTGRLPRHRKVIPLILRSPEPRSFKASGCTTGSVLSGEPNLSESSNTLGLPKKHLNNYPCGTGEEKTRRGSIHKSESPARRSANFPEALNIVPPRYHFRCRIPKAAAGLYRQAAMPTNHNPSPLFNNLRLNALLRRRLEIKVTSIMTRKYNIHQISNIRYESVYKCELKTNEYQLIFMEFVEQLDDVELSQGYFQQDDATCHTSNESMELIASFFDDRIISRNLWSSRSPDLKTPDFFLWG
ncbi:hypothetical protein ANN_15010 [Periplaneta americana]|uniref:Uncharacterized protein n=1 Tax=Periplaneta americana TaxID=6978 RepID=A0ABQ8SZ08_PERAM|nr:hypothetical protein ANN_15010 [Periplaneta americana]